jgi:hypothetical protein
MTARVFSSLGWALAGVLWLGSGGCVGSIGDGRTPSGADRPGPTPTPGSPSPKDGTPGASGPAPGAPAPSLPGKAGVCQEAAPAISPLRRLTREQFGATLVDLLGDQRALGMSLPDDGSSEDLFDDAATLIVTPDWATRSLEAAEQAAKAAVANLGALVPCKPEAGDESCARQFITTFGKRAYRRPLEATEVTALAGVYRAGAAEGFASGIELVITAMLQSPSFVYRVELGRPGGAPAGAVKLTPYEVAARLSYTLWGTMPDKELMDAADAGKLGTAAELGAQARRLLADPRGHAALVAFHQRWLELGNLDDIMKDAKKYPQYTPKLVAALKAGTGALLEELLFKGDGRLESLLTAKAAFVDSSLAPLYGAPAPAGMGLQRIEPGTGVRSGLLTDVGVLAAHTFADGSAPIHRGKFVRERLLCTTPPSPPANIDIVAPEVPANLTIRQALAQHRADPSCKTCHELMDPIGFGFSAYDGLGAWRTSEAGKPVDSTGYFALSKDLDGPFDGVGELAQRLSGSGEVRECIVANVVGFVQGPEVAGDACVMTKLRPAFEAAKHDLRELLIAVVGTDGFQYRRLLAGEVSP